VLGREYVLIIANKHHKFEIFLLVPLALSNFFAFLLHRRFHQIRLNGLLLDHLISREGLVVKVDTAVDERHVVLILYRIQKNKYK